MLKLQILLPGLRFTIGLTTAEVRFVACFDRQPCLLGGVACFAVCIEDPVRQVELPIGDFNFDNVVDAADYLEIDTAFAAGGGTYTPAFLAAREAEFGPGYVASLAAAAVPEPSAAAGLVGALAAAAWRRRSRHHFLA